ncbi:GNAT family N-acetyltransferase [uncultured Treponema sp.]|uniref:GNAT family N-acetyltransferase n=1 Tax=uncultured Treponema sp. TaxID=162155 RepID=UPI0025EDA75D|nr:GNAT family N-acetyltransferase [uncultured Treponema sp.]
MPKIIQAAENEEFFLKAENFLLPHEKICSQLMQMAMQKSKELYIIFETEILGVFYFSEGGILTSFIPRLTKETEKELCNFFCEKEISCIMGEKKEAEKIRKLIFKLKKIQPDDIREMLFMEYTQSKNISAQNLEIAECSLQDADKLFPLHISYTQEEVLPEWKKINLALERLKLEKILRTQKVLAVKKENSFCAKAQTNAISKNFIQIGGVFTQKEFRSKGFASTLVKKLAEEFQKENKKSVLFVNKKNKSAICAYKKAGFSAFAKYEMLYYK